MATALGEAANAGSNLVQGLGTNSATFTMPGSVGLDVESVLATIDNTAGAATTALLTISDSAGEVIARQRQGSTIPAGGTGTATWALRLGGNGVSSSTSPGGELDYVERDTTLVVTATTSGTAQVFITGNSVTYDGATRVIVEVWCPYMDVERVGLQKSVVLVLYEDGVELGWLVNLESPSSVGAGKLSETVSGRRFLTPSAGAHVYSIRAFKDSGGTTADVGARPGGPGEYFPAWYRISIA